LFRPFCAACICFGCAFAPHSASAQNALPSAPTPTAPATAPAAAALSWDEVKAKFQAVNPVLKSDQLGVDELKAD